MGNRTAKPKGRYLNELIKKVPNMNFEEVLNTYEEFQAQSRGSGRLKQKDFIEVYKRAFQGNKGATALAESIFQSFDTDNSGYIDFEEFLVGLSLTEASLGGSDRETKLKKLKWAFNVYDKDRSGTIDKHEMRSIVRVVAELTPEDSFLRNGSAEDFADRLFNQVDANGDGDITFEEFRRAAEINETLIDLLLPAPTV
ncbi:neuronal calcium sensor 2-like [Dreissena polymorpha]|uniref:neuronal calcium sensor 2-like n=1 Tax=Dreissena polymorpha TaxID=45954 RepID=UPI002264BF7A|nr:neuronal calcium sensor 2-like [Dreissena polymorpha]